MNIARVGLLVVAIAAAAAAAFLVRTLTHKSPQETAERAPVMRQAQVLVAARALDPGIDIKPGDLRWQAWPEDSLSPSFLTAEAAPQAIKDSVGSTVRVQLDPGEPITSTKLVHGAGGGFLAAMLGPGMRAISIEIEDKRAAGNFILPGDHVDVVMTRRLERGDAGSGDNYESRTVLSNVKVLAIGPNAEDANNEKTMVGKTATLELTPQEAELLALADEMGNITLVLRSVEPQNITAATGPRAAGLGNRNADGAIRVVRYSHTSRVMPAQISSGDGR